MSSYLVEQVSLQLAIALYIATCTGMILDSIYKYRLRTVILFSGISALIIHAYSIGVRWHRVNHGPFINLYEILTSNIWSLSLGYLLFYWFSYKNKSTSFVFVPILLVLIAWIMSITPNDTYLPATYNTIWLYFHVFSGKIFLGLLLISTMLAGTILLSRLNINKLINNEDNVVELMYRFIAFAFLFDSLMLVFGAIWAQDAWGRYWAWDPLETWAFLTWLLIVFTLHWRIGNQRKTVLFSLLIVSCFILAFITFFGVPFLSSAPHKGMI